VPRSQRTGARGYSCDLFVDPPDREWNDFVHARNELVTVVEGRLEVKVAGSRFVAEPGDEVFIPKGNTASGELCGPGAFIASIENDFDLAVDLTSQVFRR
jgi:quercetin dioxygenase-like cupin family protein